MEQKTIMYIEDHLRSFDFLRRTCEREGLPYQWMEFQEKLRELLLFPEKAQERVTKEDVARVVGHFDGLETIDLLLIHGKTNTDLGISAEMRKRGLKTRILVSPTYAVAGESHEAFLARVGADFGWYFDGPYKQLETLENVFAGRTGGYFFNPEMYEDRNGLLVPKS